MEKYLISLAIACIILGGVHLNGQPLGTFILFIGLVWAAILGIVTVIADLWEAVKKWRG